MTKILSSWWASDTHRAVGRTEDKAVRLALALGSVKSIVRVVDRSLPPMNVDWAQVRDGEKGTESLSYTDFRGGAIRVNPKPLLDGRLDHAAALDVEIGFALHEASHSQESRDRFEALLAKKSERINGKVREWEVPAFEPMRIAAYLWNVVEDVRIESVTSRNWPGFAPYFGAVLDYMWDEMRAHHELPVEYGPDLMGKLKTVFLSCRYPEEAEALPAPMQPEVAWWEAWQADYLAGRTDTKETIQRALDHLGEDKKTKQELDQMAAAERKERERGEKVRAQIERLMREGLPDGYGVCITADGEVEVLDEETADAVRQLVKEELVEHKTIIKTVGGRSPSIHVRKPQEDSDSRRAYVGKPNADSERLRTMLVFRNSAPQYDLKLLKSGRIDDEELYRFGMGDYRVFSERVVEAKPEVFMGLLVDLSGSMHGRKLQIAQQLAQLFAWALHDQEGVETRVWGHTGDLDETNSSEVFRLWEKGDPLSRLGLIATIEHSDNYDGHALSYVVKQVADQEQPQKIVIVLSDGLPSGHGYGGPPAANHIRHVVRWAEGRGVKVLQIAIDPYGVRPEDQATMYGHGNWIPFKDVASLPRQLAAVMGRML